MNASLIKRAKEFGVTALLLVAMVPAAFGQSQSLETVLEKELRPLMRKQQLLDAVRASNTAHASDTLDQIMAKDQEWRSQLGKESQPFVKGVLDNPASQLVKSSVSAAKGLISEIIVMDAQGLTVACWPATSDFYQGDEDQFKMTYPKGAAARHIGVEKLDESTRLPQRQLSLTLVDPNDGKPIGAITFGLDAEYLK